eukprot:3330281-Amphidinium_carterae.1
MRHDIKRKLISSLLALFEGGSCSSCCEWVLEPSIHHVLPTDIPECHLALKQVSKDKTKLRVKLWVTTTSTSGKPPIYATMN